MKYLVLAFIAIVLIQCQPSTNPSGTGACAPTSTCVPTGSLCGNATNHQDPTKYCGDAASFCDWGFSGNCIAKYGIGHACNASYYNLDCQSGNCSASVCSALTPVTTSTPAPYVYEGTACSGTAPCHPSLSCVSSVCQKFFANSAACVSSNDCTPGSVCANSICATQTSTKVIGVACTADTDCNGQAGLTAECVCNSPGASAGTCGAPDQYNGLAFTGAAVTNCQALVNQYKNGGTITASNAATAATNYGCAISCAYLNGPSVVTKAWQANNHVGSYTPATGTSNNCVYTAPTRCSNPTTTGPTKASATSVIASLFLTVLALLF